MKQLAADLDALCRRMRAERQGGAGRPREAELRTRSARPPGMLDPSRSRRGTPSSGWSEGEFSPLADESCCRRTRCGAASRRGDAALYALDSGNPERLALPRLG